VGGDAGTQAGGARRRELAIAATLTMLGALIVALSLSSAPGARTDPLGPRVFPLALGVAIGFCGCLLAVAAARLHRGDCDDESR
jgi:hypothetical protein